MKKLYAFLDIDNPMVAWEVAVGRIKSASYDRTSDFGLSIWSYNLMHSYLKNGMSDRIQMEFELEKIRAEKFSDKVSRLKGVYFFESFEDAKESLDHFGNGYDESYISEVSFEASSFSKYDFNWITNSKSIENKDWMKKYWNGDSYSEKPIYEIIAEGMGIVLNYDLRTKAYETIYNHFGDSTPLLATAVCAFHAKGLDNVLTIKPALIVEETKLIGSYFIDTSYLDTNQGEIIEAIEICKSMGIFPPIKRPKNEEALANLPDLREYGFELDINELREKGTIEIFK